MKKKNSKTISRRGFVRRTGGAAAAFGLFWMTPGCGSGQEGGPAAPDAPAAPAAPKTGYGSFKMGFQSYSLRQFPALDDFIREASKLPLSYVELFRGHLGTDAAPEQIEETRQRLADAGLTVNAFGVEAFSADHAANEKLFQFGKALGVTNLSADPTKDAFDSLDQLVKQYDIRIAIHNHGPEDERWRRPEWILEAVEGRDPRIGSCSDLGHFIRADVDPVAALETLGARVLGVHLKDFDADGKDVVLGEGRLDLKGVMSTLAKIGFDGPLSLEFEGEDPVVNMQACLQRVREAIA